jgi:BirA family biotin operon repressor/biotin-[acetyl-CoA-carboxylase] ligase
VLPFHLHWFPRLRSTNDHAALLRKRGRFFAPAIVLTGHQTAGRGRGGNSWWSTGGVITATFALAVEENLPAGELPLIAGLAARAAAAEMTGRQDIQLKWPNDVLFGRRKLAGLLCERVNKLDLIGIGMNVNLDPKAAPGALSQTITSLAAIRGGMVDQTQALIALAGQLHRRMKDRRRQPFGVFLAEYHEHHALLGRRVRILADSASPAITGKVEGIDPQARLLVRDRGTLHRIVAGHVAMI